MPSEQRVDRPADRPAEPGGADAVVIGAGVIGCAVALELTRRGRDVVVVERNAAAGAGSTSSSSAVIRFSYTTADGVHLSREGLWYWQNWERHIGWRPPGGLAEFRRCPKLMIEARGFDYAGRVRRLWEQLDVPFESLTPEQLRHRFPWMDQHLYGPPARVDDEAFWKDATGTMTGALLSPDSGYVSDPRLAALNLHAAAEREGGRFEFGAEVASILRDGARVDGVGLTDGRTVTAPVVVNVAGPHSAVINRLAGVREAMGVKTAPIRQEVHHLPAPPTMDLEGSGLMMADEDVGFYCRPDIGNHLLVGSIEPDCDELEWLEDPDEANPELTELWTTQALRANRRFPELGVPHRRRGSVGVYDVSDDWLPIYDRTDLDGFYVAIGTSGNQFKNACAAAQLMGDLIDAVESGHDHDAEPLQVVGRNTGRPIDLGAFARNRDLAGSSMSVIG